VGHFRPDLPDVQAVVFVRPQERLKIEEKPVRQAKLGLKGEEKIMSP
jgi:hypothetical protein